MYADIALELDKYNTLPNANENPIQRRTKIHAMVALADFNSCWNFTHIRNL